MAFLTGWIGLLLGFSGLIFIHELGHFALAKWNGVRVYVFSLGMGPYLLSFSYKGTVYALSMIPIGGYVKLQGQDDLNPNEEVSKDPHDYRNKRPGQKAAILAAGAAFNLIFTVFIFTVTYMIGVDVEPPRVGIVDVDKPLAQATAINGPARKIEAGDEIVEVNGVPVRRFLDANLQIAGSSRSEPLTMRVKKTSGDIVYFNVTPERDSKQGASSIGLNAYTEKLHLQLGFETEDTLYVAADPKKDKLTESGAAAEAGLTLGDEILRLEFPDNPEKPAVDFKPFANTADEPGRVEQGTLIRDVIRKSEGKKMVLTVKREGQPEPILITLTARKEKESDASYMIGAQFGYKHRVTRVSPESEAYKAGLRENCYVYEFAINDVKEFWNEHSLRYEPRDGTLIWSKEWTNDEKAGEKSPEKTVEKTPIVLTADSHGLVFVQSRVQRQRMGPLGAGEALAMAWSDTRIYSASVFTVLKGLFTGTVGVKALSGPAGIGKVMFTVASNESRGAFVKYLWFLGFISLNLGVLQFVPIPLLDGWHLLMVFIEKIKGSPVQPKIQEAFQYVGLFLIGGLLLLATFNDIKRIFM